MNKQQKKEALPRASPTAVDESDPAPPRFPPAPPLRTPPNPAVRTLCFQGFFSRDSPAVALPSPAAAAPPPLPAAASAAAAAVPPLREDCWSEGSTFALIHAWGDRFLALDRGNFSQQDWQDVAQSVNSRPSPSSGEARRTGAQCKNRIDTLKKKFKLEKARVSDPAGGGCYLSPWPFFADLDALIGSNFPPPSKAPSRSPTPPPAPRSRPRPRPKRGAAPRSARSVLPPAVTVPVRPRSHNRTKRAPARSPAGGSCLRPAFSAADEEAAEEESGRFGSRTKPRSGEGSAARRERGYAELAEAIERLGQIYERVERKKAREMIELEKQRMQFAKDLEQQRMRWFLETQIHLPKDQETEAESNRRELLVDGHVWEEPASPGFKLGIAFPTCENVPVVS
ncbi:hypothetical protein NL676_017357 [Syzygium grande]|nr:hypothetical protein NL676_017357 [Syzygium grande]